MGRITSFAARALTSAAAASMMATPALARGWNGGWGGDWGHRRHHDGVDAGDVIAGVLILGTIAAIASAASKPKQLQPRYPQQDYPPQGSQQGSNNGYGNGNDPRPEWHEGGGINDAVNRCIDEVSRGSTRIDAVDSVNREGDGWRVQGRAVNGGAFACSIDGQGRIRNITIDGHAY